MLVWGDYCWFACYAACWYWFVNSVVMCIFVFLCVVVFVAWFIVWIALFDGFMVDGCCFCCFDLWLLCLVGFVLVRFLGCFLDYDA